MPFESCIHATHEVHVDRRKYSNFLRNTSTFDNLPVINTPQPTTVRVTDPFKQFCSRTRLVELLEGQVEISRGRYPVCLIRAQLQNKTNDIEKSEAVMQPVARLLSLNLRPTDIVTRYGPQKIAMILPGADEAGGNCAVRRLNEYLDKLLTINTVRIKLAPLFGFASNFDCAEEENLLSRRKFTHA